MVILVGMAISEDKRVVMMCEGMPVLTKITTVVDEMPPTLYDWGRDASEDASLRLSRLLMTYLPNAVTRKGIDELYAEEVIRSKMLSGKMWLLSLGELEEWVISKQVQ